MKHIAILLAFLVTLSSPAAAQDFNKGFDVFNAGKLEFSLLMKSQDVPKLTVLRDECASIYQAYDSSK